MDESKHALIQRLSDELDVLEKEAGITDAAAKAREGRFIPFGALGDDFKEFTHRQNNQLYFDSEHDDRRDKIRRLYFTIDPLEIRKKLIAKNLEIVATREGGLLEDIENGKRELHSAKQKAEKLPWVSAGITAAIYVLLGYWIGNMVGALAGALIGFFFGQGTIHNYKRDQANAVRQAEEDLKSEKDSFAEWKSQPDYFSFRESQSGIEDKDFSMESAFHSRVQQYSKDNAG